MENIKFRVIKDNKIVAFEELYRNCWRWCYAENGKPNNKMQVGVSFYNDCERQQIDVSKKGSGLVEIVGSDIATIECLHDILTDAHGYSFDLVALKRARELTAKMYASINTNK